MLFIYFQLQVYIAVKTRVFIQSLLSQDQEPESNEKLKIYMYDHDQRGSSRTLEHLKNCRKNTRKSADAVAEFASSKGLGMLSFFLRPPSVCESKFRG